MKNLLTGLAILCALMLGAKSIWAAEEHTAAHSDAAHTTTEARMEHELPHPEISANDEWAGSLVSKILLFMFLPAFLLGPIVAMNKPAEPVVAHDDHGHDDAHGGGHDAHGHDAHDSHGHGH